MSISDEIDKLHDMHQRGALSDEEFTRAKARVLNDPVSSPAISAANCLRRSSTDRWVGGVCAGIARSLGIEAWIARLLFTILLLCGGVGLFLYLLLWIFVPSE